MLLFVDGVWVATVTGRRLCVCSGKGFGKKSNDSSNQPPKENKGKKVKIVPCEDCQGTGKFLCPICKGTGEMIGFTQTIPVRCVPCEGVGSFPYKCKTCKGFGHIE
mmetsp:Transcript_28863/g.112429  ORF Transcript_28863/g.112429 Transcript_28863/m.112429 type:complete len:106 (+) Transcript_28863:165-482(+)